MFIRMPPDNAGLWDVVIPPKLYFIFDEMHINGLIVTFNTSIQVRLILHSVDFILHTICKIVACETAYTQLF